MQGPSISWSDLKAGINTASSFRDKVAQEAANFACGLYKKYPDWAKGSGPARNMLDGLWGDLCDGRPPGLPNGAPPFEGGQCCNKEYLVTITYEAFFYSGGVCQSASLGTFNLTAQRQGAITSVRNTDDGRAIELLQTFCDGSTNVGLLTQRDEYCRKLKSVSVAVAPGFGSDDCGDLPGGYPNTGAPTPEEMSVNLPIKLPSGLPITLPIALVNVSVDAGINLNVGSIPVTIDFGGLTFSPNIDINIGGGGDDGGDGDGDGEGDYVPSHKPPYPSNYDEGGRPESEAGGEDGINNLKWVTVSLTTIPTNAKKQFGMGAPDVIYAGWFEWRAAGKCLPREPIHFQENVFRAPDGVDGYAYTVQSGYKATAIVHTEKAQGDP